MPAPYTRRVFLGKGLTMLAAGVTAPTFIDRTAAALARVGDDPLVAGDSGRDGKVLVVVQLSGGNDGLNTLVPYADDAYRRARPQLRLGGNDVLKVDGYHGLHPGLASVKELFDDGRALLVQGVGYPNPNRSHFRSMDIWHTADPREETIRSGWLGRFFDAQCGGEDPGGRLPDPQIGVSIGGETQIAMQGERVAPLSFERPEDYRYHGEHLDPYLRVNAPSADRDEPSTGDPTEADQLDFLTRTAMDAQVSSDRVLAAVGDRRGGDYPAGNFGQALRGIAAMIRADLPTRVYYVSLGGFDTHAQQGPNHTRLMNTFASGTKAFMDDLKRHGNDQRVLVMTFSEFGRRVAENASAGTDHGAAAPMFFFGGRVNPGLAGRHPSLTDLDNGDLKYGIDFRSCYAGVLHHWLDVDPATCARILGGRFDPLPVARG